MDDKVLVLEVDGVEETYEFYSSFSHPETEADYDIFAKEDEEGIVFVATYGDKDEIVENEEELQFIESVLEALDL